MAENYQLDSKINLLKKLGVTINDKTAFASTIMNYGYNEVVTQYLNLFRKSEAKREPIDFLDIQQLYQLDQSLKNVMMISLQLFEQTFKTALTNTISKQFDPDNLTQLFATEYQLQDGHVIRRGDLQARIRHIRQHYLEPFPGYRVQNNDQLTPWVLVKEMSFGVATNAFFLLAAKKQAQILDCLFKAQPSIRDFEKLLNDLKVFRGRAAHNYRLLGVKINQDYLYSTVLDDLALLNNQDPSQYALTHLQPILSHYLANYPEQSKMIHSNLGN